MNTEMWQKVQINNMIKHMYLYLYLYEYVEDTNTGFNSTGERAPIDGVGEQIWSSQRR